jgi:hypothetical protein
MSGSQPIHEVRLYADGLATLDRLLLIHGQMLHSVAANVDVAPAIDEINKARFSLDEAVRHLHGQAHNAEQDAS